jgi:glycosyltransferase involved in cell wall biosynthesis
MQDAIDETTERKQFDIIHCCVQFFGYFRFPVGIPVTSDTHEVKYDLLHRTAQKSKNLITKVQFYLAYRLGKDEEIKLCRKFDLLTTTTERDRDLFAKDIPAQRIISVQNGAGNSFFEDIGIEPELYSISFTGLFTHVPNTEGIIWFLDEVWPKIVRQEPRAKLYVVGKNPPRKLQARASDNVVITGFVEDVRPYIARSTVFAIPLLAGGGIRGKALEAMAMKRPIVTTGIGVEGIYLVHGKSALFADNPQDFADAVIRLFREPPLREEIARNAFSVVNAHYDWAAKGKELNAVLESVVQSYRKSMGCLIPIDNRVSC